MRSVRATRCDSVAPSASSLKVEQWLVEALWRLSRGYIRWRGGSYGTPSRFAWKAATHAPPLVSCVDKLAPVEAPLSIVVAFDRQTYRVPGALRRAQHRCGSALGGRSAALTRSRSAYASLPKVSLEADPVVTLDEVLTRAANELGEDNGNPRLHGFRLFEPRLAEGFPPDEPSGERDRVSSVDAEGRLWWRGVNELDLPYSWLINATDAGLVAGDPFRPYLMLGGRGSLRHGLGPVTWQELHELLNALEPWLGSHRRRRRLGSCPRVARARPTLPRRRLSRGRRPPPGLGATGRYAQMTCSRCWNSSPMSRRSVALCSCSCCSDVRARRPGC